MFGIHKAEMFQKYLDWLVVLSVYCKCDDELLDVSELTYLSESILHRLYKKVGNGTQIIYDIETYYHGLNEVLEEVENKTLAGITVYKELIRTFGPPHTHITYDSYDYKKAYNFTSEEAEHVERIMDDTKQLWWLIDMKFSSFVNVTTALYDY